ncbi:MAG: lamin tail domain-containing protein [Thermoflexales bacterium]|nr:lamin tail domain-containing protein [Thermoflexales bacterium]
MSHMHVTMLVLSAAALILAGLLLLSPTPSPSATAADGTWTPTAWVYLPYICAQKLPTPTPTVTPSSTPTATPTPSFTPSPTPSSTATTPPASPTPTLPPPSFNNCQEGPDPSAAANFPVRIVTVYKAATPEAVKLENLSVYTVDLSGWRMCSITGNQEHTGIGGMLAPGEVKDFPRTGGGTIWNNSDRDDGALYNAAGQLVSYWIDQ